jgi:hypothetical protein
MLKSMKFLYFFLLPIILVFSGCNSTHETTEHNLPTEIDLEASDKTPELVIDLNKSTNIIVHLLKEGDIAKVLAPEAHNAQETIDILIKNFSPAEMAFDAEVLNFKDPVIVLFYDETDSNALNYDSSFKEVAYKYYNKAKFVTVEVTKLFKLAEQAGITVAPTLMLINNRAEVARIEKPDFLLFDTELNALMTKLDALKVQ